MALFGRGPNPWVLTPEARNSAPKPPHQVSSVPCQCHASHPGLSGRCPMPYLFCVSSNDCAVVRDRPGRFLRPPLAPSAHPCYYSSTAPAVEPLQSITDPAGTSADLSHFHPIPVQNCAVSDTAGHLGDTESTSLSATKSAEWSKMGHFFRSSARAARHRLTPLSSTTPSPGPARAAA